MSTRQRIKKAFWEVVIVMVLVNSAAYANLVTNGGFEITGDNIQVHTDMPSDPDTVGLWKFNVTSGINADNAQGDVTKDGTLTDFDGTSGQDIDVVDQSQSVSDNESSLTAAYTMFAQAITPDYTCSERGLDNW